MDNRIFRTHGNTFLKFAAHIIDHKDSNARFDGFDRTLVDTKAARTAGVNDDECHKPEPVKMRLRARIAGRALRPRGPAMIP